MSIALLLYVLVAAALSRAHIAWAYPTGSGYCTDSVSAYTMSIMGAKLDGNAINITVAVNKMGNVAFRLSPGPTNDYKGFLIYVADEDSVQVGSIVLPNAVDFGYKNCVGAGNESVLQHINPNPKKNFIFTWTPPMNDESDSTYSVHGVIVNSNGWLRLKPVSFAVQARSAKTSHKYTVTSTKITKSITSAATANASVLRTRRHV
ncbi:hypothetical protein DFJ73DRAFT_854434 [Zopfochytrium polystomum]|nr:hypothetical protein DFJ73DRAFT_854434 [Zopfochytrium polystomum]